jgi:AraC-like DNA-binding protein
VTPVRIDPKRSPPAGEVRHGTRSGPPDVRLLGGYFVSESPDAALLVSLLPAVVHVRGVERLPVLVRLVADEASESRSGRDLVLRRLVEVLLIEALRSTVGEDTPPGLPRGLADARLAPAIRQMHGQLARSWTVAQLAKTAALSRSAFFERFTRTVGLAPMEYLLAWRMAVAKDLLRRHDMSVADVARRVGYGSASIFSKAFTRHTGQPPSRYARQALDPDSHERSRSAHRSACRRPNASPISTACSRCLTTRQDHPPRSPAAAPRTPLRTAASGFDGSP